MELRFENIFAALLLILILWIGIKMQQPLLKSLSCIGQIGPGNNAQEQWLGVLVLTILCFTFACLVKLLTHRDR